MIAALRKDPRNNRAMERNFIRMAEITRKYYD